MAFIPDSVYHSSASSHPAEKQKPLAAPSPQEVVSALESYFQETALTQQMPLPRWAVW